MREGLENYLAGQACLMDKVGTVHDFASLFDHHRVFQFLPRLERFFCCRVGWLRSRLF
jgi:hypothetical protein